MSFRGTHTKRRGRTVNTGKSYQPHPSHSLLISSRPFPTPSVPLSTTRAKNIGLESDYLMHLDPPLPTEEEVRRSYGRVLIQHFSCCSELIDGRARMIISPMATKRSAYLKSILLTKERGQTCTTVKVGLVRVLFVSAGLCFVGNLSYISSATHISPITKWTGRFFQDAGFREVGAAMSAIWGGLPYKKDCYGHARLRAHKDREMT